MTMTKTWCVKRFASAVLWEYSDVTEIEAGEWMENDVSCSDDGCVTLSRPNGAYRMINHVQTGRASCVHCQTWTCSEYPLLIASPETRCGTFNPPGYATSHLRPANQLHFLPHANASCRMSPKLNLVFTSSNNRIPIHHEISWSM